MKFQIRVAAGLYAFMTASVCLAAMNDQGLWVKKKKDVYIDCRVTVTDKNGKLLKGIAFNTHQVTSWKGVQASSRFPAMGGRPLFLGENYGLLWMNENFSAEREANLIQRLLKKDKVRFSEEVTIALTKPFNEDAFEHELKHADELHALSRRPIRYIKVSATASGGHPQKTYVPELGVYVASECGVYVPEATGKSPSISDEAVKNLEEPGTSSSKPEKPGSTARPVR